jgi:hypothetical protein
VQESHFGRVKLDLYSLKIQQSTYGGCFYAACGFYGIVILRKVNFRLWRPFLAIIQSKIYTVENLHSLKIILYKISIV